MVGPVRQRIFDAVVAEASRLWCVSDDDILGRGRENRSVIPRQAVCYVLRERLGWALTEIGEYVGRDHSTVISAVSRIEQAISNDRDIAELVQSLAASLGDVTEIPLTRTDVGHMAANAERLASALLITLDANDRALQAQREVLKDTRRVLHGLLEAARQVAASEGRRVA